MANNVADPTSIIAVKGLPNLAVNGNGTPEKAYGSCARSYHRAAKKLVESSSSGVAFATDYDLHPIVLLYKQAISLYCMAVFQTEKPLPQQAKEVFQAHGDDTTLAWFEHLDDLCATAFSVYPMKVTVTGSSNGQLHSGFTEFTQRMERLLAVFEAAANGQLPKKPAAPEPQTNPDGWVGDVSDSDDRWEWTL